MPLPLRVGKMKYDVNGLVRYSKKLPSPPSGGEFSPFTLVVDGERYPLLSVGNGGFYVLTQKGVFRVTRMGQKLIFRPVRGRELRNLI